MPLMNVSAQQLRHGHKGHGCHGVIFFYKMTFKNFVRNFVLAEIEFIEFRLLNFVRFIPSKVKEESVIDFVIVCEEMEAMVSDMIKDESRKHVLTKQTKN